MSPSPSRGKPLPYEGGAPAPVRSRGPVPGAPAPVRHRNAAPDPPGAPASDPVGAPVPVHDGLPGRVPHRPSSPVPHPALVPVPVPVPEHSAGPGPHPSDSPALLHLNRVTKSFGAHGPAVDGVTLGVAAGETVGLVGESGSGKSTLARLALGLLAPDTGTVRFASADPYRLRGRGGRAVRARLQFVPQHPGGSLNPALPAGEAIAFSLRAHGVPRAERRDRVAELLHSVGLAPGLARRRPSGLSGGQLQRVAIARALATGPALVVCDEPTSALDPDTRDRVLDLLVELRERTGLGYLFITHDLAVVARIADRVVVLRHGRVVEEGPSARVFDAPAHPYTRALLAAASGRPLPGDTIPSP
ncbi:ABC transporter ATP-binding protein [Streptomyces lichenis]|uniref:ATP-binding cassette domain-containing protein n=1 Tax=Streptomyces lichenis TaxID=2306967 RepID=A0ABT0I8F5_9ACTN|nr:ABC transporter ATP-binding protein [Streptomyces lichenis]MCK8677603.1 ATP-binding cassette domain-containing protein [Streptomyces lichenis]